MTVRIANLRKEFGGVVALAGVDLTINAGEIHALLGPNGAGKSTLIRCLGGANVPDEGEIWLDDQPLDHLTTAQAIKAGVAVIYQNLSLINTLSVSDNLFLGSELTVGPFRRSRVQKRRTAAILREFLVDTEIDPDAKVGELPIASRQIVEIAKALNRGDVRLLILDEPTAALTDVEAQALARRLESLKARGLHILYTTHLVKEVFEIADRVTVLRDGRVVLSGRAVLETTQNEVIAAIVGREGSNGSKPQRTFGAPLLELERLHGDRFGPLSLDVREGEIVALFGLLGSGRTELLETIFGARRRKDGAIAVRGRGLSASAPAAAIGAGVALVPAERLKQGIFLPLTALDNLLLPSFSGLAFGGLRRRRVESGVFRAAASNLDLRPARPGVRAGALSGGNQQKLVVGRWLETPGAITVLLLDEPTQGIDVGARQEIYRIMRAAAERRRAILFASSDPEEVETVADRAVVMHRGEIVGELTGSDLNEEALLTLAHMGES